MGRTKKKSAGVISKHYDGRAIFEDTKLPHEPNDVVLIYLRGYDLNQETLATYFALAKKTLSEHGFETASWSGLIDNCDLPAEVYEAMRLVSLYNHLEAIKNLRSKIANEHDQEFRFVSRMSARHRRSKRSNPGKDARRNSRRPKPTEGYENLSSLIEEEKSTALQVGALGERIKARRREEITRYGQKRLAGLQDTRKGSAEAASKVAAPWKRYFRWLIRTKHRQWTPNALADHALRIFESHKDKASSERPLILKERSQRALWTYADEVLNDNHIPKPSHN